MTGPCCVEKCLLKGDQGATHRAAQRHTAHGHCPALPQGLLCSTQHVVHDVRNYSRNQSYSTLRYQQQQFDVQEHQRAAYEQYKVAAAPATSRAAGQMTSRFKEIENDAEANLSQQQRGLLFHSAASQHHHLIQVTIIFSVAQAASDVAPYRQ